LSFRVRIGTQARETTGRQRPSEVAVRYLNYAAERNRNGLEAETSPRITAVLPFRKDVGAEAPGAHDGRAGPG
jgi:hypothetical protein